MTTSLQQRPVVGGIGAFANNNDDDVIEANYDLVRTLQNVLGSREAGGIMSRFAANPNPVAATATTSTPLRSASRKPVIVAPVPAMPPSSATPLQQQQQQQQTPSRGTQPVIDRDVEALARFIQQKDYERIDAVRLAEDLQERLRILRDEHEKLKREHDVVAQESTALKEINKGFQVREDGLRSKLDKTQSSLTTALSRLRDMEAKNQILESETIKKTDHSKAMHQLLSQAEAVHAQELTDRERQVAQEVRAERDALKVKLQEADAERRAAIAAMATVVNETDDLGTKATDMDLEARLVTTTLIESLDGAEVLVGEPTGIALLLERLTAIRQQVTQIARFRQDLDYFKKRFRVVQNRLITPATAAMTDSNVAEEQLRQAQLDLRTIRANEAMQRLRVMEEQLANTERELENTKAINRQLQNQLASGAYNNFNAPSSSKKEKITPLSPEVTEITIGQSTMEDIDELDMGRRGEVPVPIQLMPVSPHYQALVEELQDDINRKNEHIRDLEHRLESITESVNRTVQAAHEAELQKLQEKLMFSETTVRNQQRMVEALEDQVRTINQRYEALRMESDDITPAVTSLQAELYAEKEMVKRKQQQIDVLEQKLQASYDNLRQLKVNFERKLLETEERFHEDFKKHFRSTSRGGFSDSGTATPSNSTLESASFKTKPIDAENWNSKILDLKGQWDANRDVLAARVEQLQLELQEKRDQVEKLRNANVGSPTIQEYLASRK